jgi:hypothetical protein
MMTMGHSLAQMPSLLHLFSSMIRSPIGFCILFLIYWAEVQNIRDKSEKVKRIKPMGHGKFVLDFCVYHLVLPVGKKAAERGSELF